ncbi:MAG: hypothetical protein M3397_10935 [Actinomycetota bacterium]|nr:hypothetical protein [Rubrobacter sp.]MDQ3237829.1 hypothetical protein [Actinomycetota bacterium]MDQ3568579.1 hypothetical protein [Actinomycetota bacterium]
MLTGSPNYTAKKSRPRTDASHTASSKLFVNIPSAGGGYILYGLRGTCEPLFQDVAGSTDAGLSIHECAPRHDVDTPDDLERPRRERASDPSLALRTAEILRQR